jgi:hypothetical protein
MAISKKNKRTIKYDGESFLWWLNPEFDGEGAMLSVNIASEDKKFLVKHFIIQQNPQEAYLSVIGEFFPSLERRTIGHTKVACPSFRSEYGDSAVTPKTVKDILDWCFKNDHRTAPQKL